METLKNVQFKKYRYVEAKDLGLAIAGEELTEEFNLKYFIEKFEINTKNPINVTCYFIVVAGWSKCINKKKTKINNSVICVMIRKKKKQKKKFISVFLQKLNSSRIILD